MNAAANRAGSVFTKMRAQSWCAAHHLVEDTIHIRMAVNFTHTITRCRFYTEHVTDKEELQ
jgi:hypothetical protein